MTQVPVEATAVRRGAMTRLATSVVVGLVLLGGTTAGTWAAFSASTTTDASFATGTLILSNTVEALDTCFSTAAGDPITDNDNDCDAVAQVAAALPTSGPVDHETESVAVTLRNEGNIDGTELELAATGACTTGPSGDTSYNGVDLDVCDDVLLMIQRYTSAGNQANDTRTGGSCVYGVDVDPADGQCDGFASGSDLADFTSLASPISLGALPHDDTGEADTRWFRVFLRLDPETGNESQGLAAAFALRWRTVQ